MTITPGVIEHVIPNLGRVLLLPRADGHVLREGFFQPEPGLFLLDGAAYVRVLSTGEALVSASAAPDVLLDAIADAVARAVGRPALPVLPARWVEGIYRLTLTAGASARLVVEFGAGGGMQVQLVSLDQRVSLCWNQQPGQRAGEFYGKHGRHVRGFIAQAEADRGLLEAHANGQETTLSAAVQLATAFQARWQDLRSAALREQAARAAGVASTFLSAQAGL